MAFVTWVSDAGARKVRGVYRTQAEANTAAAADTALTAHTGSVNNDVQPGDFINASGALLSSIPAAVRRKETTVLWKARLTAAFIAGWEAEPRWRLTFGLDHNTDAESASVIYRYHQAALAWIIADRTLYPSLGDHDRDNLTEHIWKQLRQPAYRRFADGTKKLRDDWNAVSIADNSGIYSDLLTATGVARPNADGTVIAITSATIPPGFRNTLQDST